MDGGCFVGRRVDPYRRRVRFHCLTHNSDNAPLKCMPCYFSDSPGSAVQGKDGEHNYVCI